jgi:hypothetical protein
LTVAERGKSRGDDGMIEIDRLLLMRAHVSPLIRPSRTVLIE